MGKKSESLASSSFVAGLILGIYFYTGVSVDPQDLLGMVLKAMVGNLAPQYSALVEALLIVLTIVGIWQIVTMLLSGKDFGPLGLAMTLATFFGGLTLVFVPVLGIILLIIGFLIGAFS